MREFAAMAFLSLFIASSPAQERVPQQDAERLAKLFTAAAAKLSDFQIKTEVDSGKPFSLRKGELGVMVIPDKKLSEDVIGKTSTTVTPVGQLWLRNLTTVAEGKPAGKETQRLVTVTVKDEDHALPFFLLGVRKKGALAFELFVYAKDKEPLLVLPLDKVDAKQELPVELEATKGDNDTGILTLTILGKYRAKLSVARQE